MRSVLLFVPHIVSYAILLKDQRTYIADPQANRSVDSLATLPPGWLRPGDLVFDKYSDGNEYAFVDDLDIIVIRGSLSTRKEPFRPPDPKGHAESDWKTSLIKAAPSGDRIVNSFRACKITRLQQFDHLCHLFVLPNASALQMHVYKNGGTTMARAFRTKGGRGFQHGEQVQQTQLEQLINNAGWWRTALVRDPMERAVSAFHEIKLRMVLSQGSVDCSANRAQLVDEFQSMLNHVEHDANPETHVPAGYHFLTQTHFMIDSIGGKYPLDYIGGVSDMLREEQFILQDTRLQLDHKSGPLDLGAPNCHIEKTDLPLDLQKTICRIFIDDYCCYGFAFPEACSDMACPTP